MKRRSRARPARQQPTPEELLSSLLDFIQRKFYEGRAVDFNKDRARLLTWVILWPARWLDERGVTLPADRYREIFLSIFMDGLRFGDIGNITYLPAWLAKTIQSHFDHHGEQYYEEAKSIRTLVEQTVLSARHQVCAAAPDPIQDLARAARLLATQKRPKKRPLNSQLNLI